MAEHGNFSLTSFSSGGYSDGGFFGGLDASLSEQNGPHASCSFAYHAPSAKDLHQPSAFPPTMTRPGMGQQPGMMGGTGMMARPGIMGQQPGMMGQQAGMMGPQQQASQMGLGGQPGVPMNPNAPVIFIVPTEGVGGFGGLPKMIQLPNLYSIDPTSVLGLLTVERETKEESHFF